jgi:aqualysin 1
LHAKPYRCVVFVDGGTPCRPRTEGRRRLAFVVAFCTAVAVFAQPSPVHASAPEMASKSFATASMMSQEDSSNIVAGRWIVRAGHDLPGVLTTASELGARITYRYDELLGGFAAEMDQRTASDLAADPRVTSVRPVQHLDFAATQLTPPWNLDRIDQRPRPRDETYSPVRTGKGVHVYVIDSGVRASHSEFEGRVLTGLAGQGSTGDCLGHGTHVAATIAGKTYGVAKKATIIPVRVSIPDSAGSCTGVDTDRVLAGLAFVVKHHRSGVPAVANMSIGGWADPDLDTAVRKVIADGVTVVAAAGNETMDACYMSPARVPAVLTVAATDSTDYSPQFSNWGRCIDLFAPGDRIRSASHGSRTGSRVMSGTSMAAPHVAGAAALYLQGKPTASPKTVHDAINAAASTGKVSNGGQGSPNRLLYVKGLVATTTGLSAPATASSGLPLTLTASLRNRHSLIGLPGRALTLFERKAGTTTWVAVATKKTDSAGKARFVHTPTRATDYQVRHAATGTSVASSSGIKTPLLSIVAPSTLQLSGPPAPVVHGDPAVLTTRLVSNGLGVASQALALQARPPGATTWTGITTRTTNPLGEASFNVSPDVHTEYRVVFAGTAAHGPTVSNVTTVTVAHRVTASLRPSDIREGETSELLVTISPEPAPGTSVVMQLETFEPSSGAWLAVDTITWRGTVYDGPIGGWDLFPVAGSYSLRVRALSTSRNLEGTSGPMTLTVSLD